MSPRNFWTGSPPVPSTRRGRLPSVCAKRGCVAIARGRYCSVHRRSSRSGKRRQPETRTQRLGGRAGYRSWRAKRAAFLAAHPACSRCGAKATVAHHRIKRHDWERLGLQGDPDAWSNLEPMCVRCHNRESAKGR
ncbi:MAG: HNH endonuclease [Gammaproteobacteria bacterium]|nr:HNH endonuclease [Gammaproteobacteria bacterium]